MSKKIYLYIAILSVLYSFQLLCKFQNISTPQWFSSYFADLLCLPLLLLCTLVVMKKIKKIEVLSWQMILFTLVYVSVVFEFILPLYSNRYTADKIDLIMYTAGSILFYVLQKHILTNTQLN
ncbi:MAG: hypothetical protein NT150_05515 [Bacteroidetes bacterium]|nr:hypothetical protein [Bacteroidota bacterium]